MFDEQVGPRSVHSRILYLKILGRVKFEVLPAGVDVYPSLSLGLGPPSTTIVVPVINDEASEARKMHG